MSPKPRPSPPRHGSTRSATPRRRSASIRTSRTISTSNTPTWRGSPARRATARSSCSGQTSRSWRPSSIRARPCPWSSRAGSSATSCPVPRPRCSSAPPSSRSSVRTSTASCGSSATISSSCRAACRGCAYRTRRARSASASSMPTARTGCAPPRATGKRSIGSPSDRG
jgi:hypothetical protein